MTSEIRSYRDLIAWQKGILLCKGIYQVTATFPDNERFGLISQLRRAAVSVPSNIAEGYGRRRTQDYLRFLDVARGSLAEVDTQLILSRELGFGSAAELQSCHQAVNELERILAGLSRSIAQSMKTESD